MKKVSFGGARMLRRIENPAQQSLLKTSVSFFTYLMLGIALFNSNNSISQEDYGKLRLDVQYNDNLVRSFELFIVDERDSVIFFGFHNNSEHIKVESGEYEVRISYKKCNYINYLIVKDGFISIEAVNLYSKRRGSKMERKKLNLNCSCQHCLSPIKESNIEKHSD